VLRILINKGYKVRSQWSVGYYRIDMVVEGDRKRLAIECDGDRWHPIEKLADDMARQAILERLGWVFTRIRGSAFYRNEEEAMRSVFERLDEIGRRRRGRRSSRSKISKRITQKDIAFDEGGALR
jgi:very-short-patch-repair endonuclease